MDDRKKGFFDLCNLLKRYKRPVTMTEIINVVAEEGWINDFLRLGKNTIIRQFNNHNEKYGSSDIMEYDLH